ncbi:FtsX-like permease family protein [Pendulispora albinea]|uniref:FtsX-like permease family protein n=2 Tax=Pendulispora albinea TaxID=2741071 RepID=A0ABZ2MCH3_9BACT
MASGMMEQMSRSIVDLGFGEVQVHATEYMVARSIHETVQGAPEILSRAREHGVSAAPRAFGPALLSMNEHAAGGQIWGVDPAAERELGELPKHLLRGAFLGEGNHRRRVVLGAKIARTLGADIGSRVAIIVGAVDGSVSTDMYEVEGILKPVTEMIDGTAVIMRADDFGEMFANGGGVHEIALSSHGRLSPEAVAALVGGVSRGQDVRTWRKLLPAAAGAVDMVGGSTAIVGMIFLFAAALGVLNTMLMASFERIPEFGVIRALGATPGRIVRDVAREAFLLGLVGTVVGAAFGGVIAALAQHYGINLGSVSMSGVEMSVWRPKLSLAAIVVPIAAMWVAALGASLYPAWKAGGLNPIQAMNHI